MEKRLNLQENLWNKLRKISQLRFYISSVTSHGVHKSEGQGNVLVSQNSDDMIVFEESGTWVYDNTQPDFVNSMFWRKLNKNSINHGHMRYGVDEPVELVMFMLLADGSWVSARPHLCGEDVYSAKILCNEDEIRIEWEVKGPYKNYSKVIIYS
ncbi:MAG: DUF6314 family protein [Hyphomicrobiales bacterium]